MAIEDAELLQFLMEAVDNAVREADHQFGDIDACQVYIRNGDVWLEAPSGTYRIRIDAVPEGEDVE